MAYLRVTIHTIKRMHNSINANPRWTIMTDHGQMVTAPDAACNYDVTNICGTDGSKCPVDVKIHTDRQHRITNIKEIP